MLNYPVLYSLSERVAVNIQGIGFTIERLKMIPTIKNLICRCIMIVRCEAVENCSSEIHNWCYCLDCTKGK